MKRMRIVAICGSLRRNSYNKRLMHAIGLEMENKGIDVDYIDLMNHQLPLFNQDIIVEYGIPPQLLKLRDMVGKADGLLLVSPEYCGSLTGVLKNTIDWLSISLSKDENTYSLFSGKPMAAAIATTSKLIGGSKCAEHLRGISATMGAIMMPHIMVLYDAANVGIETSEHIKAFTMDVVAFMRTFYHEGMNGNG